MDREEKQMQFFKEFLRNLLILIGIGIVLYLISPSIMGNIFELYGAIFGPIAIILLIVAALPNKKRRRD
jgi:hypothetical protein